MQGRRNLAKHEARSTRALSYFESMSSHQRWCKTTVCRFSLSDNIRWLKHGVMASILYEANITASSIQGIRQPNFHFLFNFVATYAD